MQNKTTKKKKKVYVGGTMDLFHSGHIDLLKRAKKIGDIVIVALNTDEFNERYKGQKPILSLQERIKLVKSCKYVDRVIINDGNEMANILKYRVDYILHGNDWPRKPILKIMGLTEEFLKKNKVILKLVPYTKKISTTEIKNRIAEKIATTSA